MAGATLESQYGDFKSYSSRELLANFLRISFSIAIASRTKRMPMRLTSLKIKIAIQKTALLRLLQLFERQQLALTIPFTRSFLGVCLQKR